MFLSLAFSPVGEERPVSLARVPWSTTTHQKPTSKRLNIHIQPFVPMLQPPRRKKIKRVVQIKVVVPVPVRPDKLVDLFLVPRVQVLELVHRLEFLDVEAVWHDSVCGVETAGAR
jgi:hypothetical protein